MEFVQESGLRPGARRANLSINHGEAVYDGEWPRCRNEASELGDRRHPNFRIPTAPLLPTHDNEFFPGEPITDLHRERTPAGRSGAPRAIRELTINGFWRPVRDIEQIHQMTAYLGRYLTPWITPAVRVEVRRRH